MNIKQWQYEQLNLAFWSLLSEWALTPTKSWLSDNHKKLSGASVLSFYANKQLIKSVDDCVDVVLFHKDCHDEDVLESHLEFQEDYLGKVMKFEQLAKNHHFADFCVVWAENSQSSFQSFVSYVERKYQFNIDDLRKIKKEKTSLKQNDDNLFSTSNHVGVLDFNANHDVLDNGFELTSELLSELNGSLLKFEGLCDELDLDLNVMLSYLDMNHYVCEWGKGLMMISVDEVMFVDCIYKTSLLIES